MRARAVGLEVAVDGEAHEHASPSRSRRRRSRRCSTVPDEHHRVAGEHRALHAELHAPEPAGRARPVGEEALEPRRLVRRVQEDVLGAVAVDREVVVVVHRPPVARSRARRARPSSRSRGTRARAARRPTCTSASVSVVVVVVMPHLAGSRSRCTTRRRRARRCWLRYSTSITQKRPVPSFVVFGSLTERRIWRVRKRSPGRTGSWNTIVLSVITASGSSKMLLQVEVHLQRQRRLGATRRPVVRPEPHRDHRRRRDRPAGDLRRRRRRPRTAGCRSRPTSTTSRCSRARPGTRRPPRTAPGRSASRRRAAGRVSLTPRLLLRAGPRSPRPSSRPRRAARRCR